MGEGLRKFYWFGDFHVDEGCRGGRVFEIHFFTEFFRLNIFSSLLFSDGPGIFLARTSGSLSLPVLSRPSGSVSHQQMALTRATSRSLSPKQKDQKRNHIQGLFSKCANAYLLKPRDTSCYCLILIWTIEICTQITRNVGLEGITIKITTDNIIHQFSNKTCVNFFSYEYVFVCLL